MKHEEKYFIEATRQVPIVQLREIIDGNHLQERWPGMTAEDIRDIIPDKLTPYALRKTYQHPDGGEAYDCAKGVRMPTVAISILEGPLHGLVFDMVEVQAYESGHPECQWKLKADAPGLDPQVLDVQPNSPAETGTTTTDINHKLLRYRAAKSLASILRNRKLSNAEIAREIDETFPGYSHPELGDLLAAGGDIRNTAADKKRGQRARGKAR